MNKEKKSKPLLVSTIVLSIAIGGYLACSTIYSIYEYISGADISFLYILLYYVLTVAMSFAIVLLLKKYKGRKKPILRTYIWTCITSIIVLGFLYCIGQIALEKQYKVNWRENYYSIKKDYDNLLGENEDLTNSANSLSNDLEDAQNEAEEAVDSANASNYSYSALQDAFERSQEINEGLISKLGCYRDSLNVYMAPYDAIYSESADDPYYRKLIIENDVRSIYNTCQ